MSEFRVVSFAEVAKSLGITIKLKSSQMVTDCFILAKIVDSEDEDTTFATTSSPGLDWLLRKGMLQAANQIDVDNGFQDVDIND